MTITPHDLVEWGVRSGPWFKDAIQIVKSMEAKEMTPTEIKIAILGQQTKIITPRETDLPFATNFLPDPVDDFEEINQDKVLDAMYEISKIPSVRHMSVMPDACPAGIIPVGAVVHTEGTIHPGYHSADVCCSMALTELETDCSAYDILNVIQGSTHFGHTKQPDHKKDIFLEDHFTHGWENNHFLRELKKRAREDFGTQGDGNHFYYVGRRASTGNICIVSHHGSRGFGAMVYKKGMEAAIKNCKNKTKGFDKGHAWLDSDSELGMQYWEALMEVRRWTKRNHFDIHDVVIEYSSSEQVDRFWNPHNFIFKKDGLYAHAKGATPVYGRHSTDDSGMSLIPMNMGHPILITKHQDTHAEGSFGFAPHGAGRNMSRTQYLKTSENLEPPENIDSRFWSGRPDPSEYPNAYKDPHVIQACMKVHGLADVVDEVIPYGSIMAGDVDYDAPWRVKKRLKEAQNK